MRVKGKELSHGMQAFVAPTATVVGDVSLGEQASVWYSATVRGAELAMFTPYADHSDAFLRLR